MKRELIHAVAVLVMLGCVSSVGLAEKPGCQVGAEKKQNQTRQRPKTCASTPAPPTSGEAQVDGMVTIRVSPRRLIIGAPIPSITVHADIPFAMVVDETVKLNGVAETAMFADDRGNLVAKFPFEDIEDLVADGQSDITLTLTGLAVLDELLNEPVSFAGKATIPVRKIGKRYPVGPTGGRGRR